MTSVGNVAWADTASKLPTAHMLGLSRPWTRFMTSALPRMLLPPCPRSMARRTMSALPSATTPGSRNAIATSPLCPSAPCAPSAFTTTMRAPL